MISAIPDSITTQVAAQAGTIADILWRVAHGPIRSAEADWTPYDAYWAGRERGMVDFACMVLDQAGIKHHEAGSASTQP